MDTRMRHRACTRTRPVCLRREVRMAGAVRAPRRCWTTPVAGVPITNTFEETDRCVNDLGFVGIMINPDPYEGSGTPTPGMGDEYWYPLYEKMVHRRRSTSF